MKDDAPCTGFNALTAWSDGKRDMKKWDKTKGDVAWKIVSLPRIESILEQQVAHSSLKELQTPHSNPTSI